MYTIGQISEMFNIPVSTIRYYDREGLLPGITRKSGRRQFSDTEVEALQVIECLKASGLEIKDIRQFMEWCTEGPETYSKRRELFENRKAAVEEELIRLNKVMDLLTFKCWYYETAERVGNEDFELPEEIGELHDRAFNL